VVTGIMPEIHFTALDLNLLRVFDALAEERSVTRAGARLGLTQSAVSHALNRLRHVLQDELFVRGPDGMRPTARAQEIAPRLRQGLHQLQLALTPSAFVPAATRRRFTVAAGTYVGALLMPAVMRRIRREAPAAEVRLRPIDDALGDDLQAGRTDLAIGAFGQGARVFGRETLFAETSVWAMRADHPAARAKELSLKSLADAPHVILASAREEQAVDGQVSGGGLKRRVIWDDGGALDVALAREGLSRTIGLTVQDAQSALAVVRETDMVALTPRRMAAAFAQTYGLVFFEPPYPSPPIAIEALWRRDLTESRPLEWLKACLRSAAAEL
jgi:DNA-binding transcriptional LysR family regulator